MKKLLLVKGSEILGKAIEQRFTRVKKWGIMNVDEKKLERAQWNVLMNWSENIEKQIPQIREAANIFGPKFDLIVSAGHVFNATMIADTAIFKEMRRLNEISIYPAMVAAQMASLYLTPNGICVIHGSYQVMKDSPSTLPPAYVISQSIIHGIAEYMSHRMQDDSRIITIAPQLFLSSNLKIKEEEEFYSSTLADYIYMWASSRSSVPPNGSIIGFKGKNGIPLPEFL